MCWVCPVPHAAHRSRQHWPLCTGVSWACCVFLLAWAPLADLVHELTVLLSSLRLMAWLWALVRHASAPVLSVSAQLLPLLSFLGVCSLSAWRHTSVLSMFPRGFQRQLDCPLYVCFFWLFPPCLSG